MKARPFSKLTQHGIKGESGKDSGRGTRGIFINRYMKGLEFNQMVIAGVNEGIVPLDLSISETEDEAVKQELYETELSLLYVAATRAKKEVLVTSFGTPSKFLNISE